MHLFSRSARLSDTAQALFDACEKGRGWEACKQYCTPDAEFKIQAVDALPGPHVTDCKTVEDYTNWMAGVVKNFGDKATYKVLSKAVDKDNCAVTFYAVFMGYSDYVYVFNFDKKSEKNSVPSRRSGMTSTLLTTSRDPPHLLVTARVQLRVASPVWSRVRWRWLELAGVDEVKLEVF